MPITDFFVQSIRNLLHGATGKPELKRRFEESTECPHITKYRRVTNDFPEFITKPFEDDIRFSQPLMSKKNTFGKKITNKFMSSKQQQNFKLNRVANNDFAQIEYSDDDEDDIEQQLYSRPLASSSFNVSDSLKSIPIPVTTLNNNIGNLNRQGSIKTSQQKFHLNENQSSSSSSSPIYKYNNLQINNITKMIDGNKKPVPHLIEARTGQIFCNLPNLKTIKKTSNYPMLNPYVTGNNSNSHPVNTNGFANSYLNDGLCGTTSLQNMNQQHQQQNQKHRTRFLQSDSVLQAHQHRSPIFNKQQQKTKNVVTNSYLMGDAKSVVAQAYNVEQRNTYANLLKKLVPNLYNSNINLFSSSSTSSMKPTGRRPIHLNNRITSTTSLPPTNENIIDHLDLTISPNDKQKPISYINMNDEIVDLDEDEVNIVSAYNKMNKEQLKEQKQKNEKNKKDELPKVEPVNSLQEKNILSEVYGDQWLKNFITKKELQYQQKKEKIGDATEEARKRTEETERQERDMEKKLKHFIISETIVIEDSEEEEEIEFPDFSESDENFIKRSIYCGTLEEVLVNKFNMNITRRDIQTLIVDNWLNDEVINFYMNLIMERGEKRDNYPKVYTMNTFFIPRLESSGYAGVRRWTRKIDLFAYDLITVPVHVSGVHWCMSIIHLKEKSIKYYDSMGSSHPTVLKSLEQYLKDESLDKKQIPFDTTDFIKETVIDCPKQMNGSDCGVFSCMIAEYISRNRNLTFSQQHMRYFRHKMVFEIVKGKLLL